MKSGTWDGRRKKVLCGLIGLLLAGCSTNVGNTVKVSDQQIAKFGTLSSEAAVAELDRHVKEARKENMQFLAPNYYNGATEILADATRALIEMPQSQVISDIAKADAILDKGQIRMGVVRSRLANELAMKTQMDKDNVAKIYPEDYQNAVGDLSKLIEKVELEKSGSLDKDKLALSKRMEALDVLAIQYTALHQSEVMNESTRNMDGAKLAAQTLAEAFRVYADAEKRIAANPHDIVKVQQASADAMFAARHARHVLQQVVAMQVKIRESVELVVMDEERLLLKISKAMELKDLRDQPVEKQASEIALAVADVVQGKQKSEQAVNTVNTVSQSLETRLREVNEVMAQNTERLAEKDVKLSEKETQLFEKSALISEKDALIFEKSALIKSLGDQILELQEQNKNLLAAKAARKTTKRNSVK
ncbi:MAG: hypothetical protein WA632_04090 [Gallionella sp.]